jgi:hypothetical protein
VSISYIPPFAVLGIGETHDMRVSRWQSTYYLFPNIATNVLVKHFHRNNSSIDSTM